MLELCSRDPSAPRRMLAMTIMALRKAGSTGVCSKFGARQIASSDLYGNHLGMAVIALKEHDPDLRVAARALRSR